MRKICRAIITWLADLIWEEIRYSIDEKIQEAVDGLASYDQLRDEISSLESEIRDLRVDLDDEISRLEGELDAQNN